MRPVYKGLVLLLALFSLTACDDNTSDIGIFPESDGITNSSETYELTTRSIEMGPVLASSTVNYLGSITDPETGTNITADFAAQFYVLENYSFPLQEDMVGDEDGEEKLGIVQCDSCEVRLFFSDYYGDGNNPMKLEVYELSSENILSEDEVYYTDIDLSQYLPADAKPIASRVFTPIDYNMDEDTRSGDGYSNNVRVVLPASFGQRIMEAYYSHPEYFTNSYYFIRNVFPGFYFKTTGGKGTMLSVFVGTINLFYRYADGDGEIYDAVTRFAATPEVLQSTHITNANMESLLADNSCTYLKTPAGICTEMTLPIDELFADEHASDSISLASITLTRYNKEQDEYQLGTPSELLMVRKGDISDFFTEHRVANSRTSYTTSFSSTYNSYTFSNICRLLSYCKHEKVAMEEKFAQGEISQAELNTYLEDWNKVVLIPVVTTTNNSGAQVSVTHDLSLNSVRLVGGDTKIKMQVVYSKFQQN
ncbi:MAG: DUF4270 domain-containing protein [Bacteroidaceae bacterium]|nr:DUF4270 domain-containing protein [Bacteroidaceae bacterium]